MIILPALSGLAALIQLIIEGAALGALFGSAMGCGAGAISEFQVQGEINKEVAGKCVEQAGEEAIVGATTGAVTGGIFGVAGQVMRPILAVIDDFFRSILGWLDDAARSVAGAVDDAVAGIRKALESVVKGIRGQFNRWRNGWNAQHYKTIAEAPEGAKYVYVIDDSATGLKKIGMTKKPPAERLEALKGSLKSELDYTCIIQTEKDSKLEGNLHSLFADQRTNHPIPHSGQTEWFVLSAVQIAAACSH
ncbi:MAG: GIY-YIG nuclease family protein [Chloroflexi bacterium]|nr:GIY-YIG nuclease family protein [Chloroflexota bacterium]